MIMMVGLEGVKSKVANPMQGHQVFYNIDSYGTNLRYRTISIKKTREQVNNMHNQLEHVIPRIPGTQRYVAID